MNQKFPEILTTLRVQANLTNRELAEIAHVPHSMIAGIQSGRRPVGEKQARKLGVALGLAGEELETFVLDAVETCTEKVLRTCNEYPSWLLNLLPLNLLQRGISPSALHDCHIAQDGTRSIITLDLKSGESVELHAVVNSG